MASLSRPRPASIGAAMERGTGDDPNLKPGEPPGIVRRVSRPPREIARRNVELEPEPAIMLRQA